MPVTGNFLVNTINASMRYGIFPASLKDSIIIPVPKKIKAKHPLDFRPINTMSTVEKLMEKIVKNQLVEYVESNNLLTSCQSGYREKYSCESALNLILAKWKEQVDQGNFLWWLFFSTLKEHLRP